MNKILLFAVFMLPVFSNAEIAIIVSNGSSISAADNKELERLFLGKTKTIGGMKVSPINQDRASPVLTEFNDVVLKKSNRQVKAYWSRLVFTGKGIPPVEVANDAEMISKVSADSGSIGYIDASAVTGDVKVLLTF